MDKLILEWIMEFSREQRAIARDVGRRNRNKQQATLHAESERLTEFRLRPVGDCWFSSVTGRHLVFLGWPSIVVVVVVV